MLLVIIPLAAAERAGERMSPSTTGACKQPTNERCRPKKSARQPSRWLALSCQSRSTSSLASPETIARTPRPCSFILPSTTPLTDDVAPCPDADTKTVSYEICASALFFCDSLECFFLRLDDSTHRFTRNDSCPALALSSWRHTPGHRLEPTSCTFACSKGLRDCRRLESPTIFKYCYNSDKVLLFTEPTSTSPPSALNEAFANLAIPLRRHSRFFVKNSWAITAAS